jgi:hypothetical protein
MNRKCKFPLFLFFGFIVFQADLAIGQTGALQIATDSTVNLEEKVLQLVFRNRSNFVNENYMTVYLPQYQEKSSETYYNSDYQSSSANTSQKKEYKTYIWIDVNFMTMAKIYSIDYAEITCPVGTTKEEMMSKIRKPSFRSSMEQISEDIYECPSSGGCASQIEGLERKYNVSAGNQGSVRID